MEENQSELPPLDWPMSDTRPAKRARFSSPPFSSDPPIFSSDDDPSIENYTRTRRKKQFRGPWFQQNSTLQVADSNRIQSPKKKRTLERHFDSGVFLGSDESDDVDMDEAAEELESVTVTTRQPARQWFSSQNAEKDEPSAEDLARQQIERCLEDGNESIDLAGRNLTSISNETLRPLHSFTRVPPVIKGVFAQIESTLRIYLGTNSLTSLPGELFNLSQLTVLSLRMNKLQELPPSIGKLHNLTELNISNNRLQYLPFEILDLFSLGGHMQSFQIHPNHFHTPQFPREDAKPLSAFKIGIGSRPRQRRGAICGVSPEHRRRSWDSQWKVTYRARTEVRYLDFDGSHLQGPQFSNHTLFGPQKFSDGIPIADVDDVPAPPSARGNPVSRAPCLLEVALNACSRTSELPYLASKLPDLSPGTFPALLANAAAKKESGGSKCTICKRSFIIPRVEWIEWWEIAKETPTASAASPLRQMENDGRDDIEAMIPLIRRGCSWLCVPEKVVLEKDGMDVDNRWSVIADDGHV